MAACAIRLLEDERLAQRIVSQAHAECAKYSWAKVRDEWLKLYLEVARRPSVERETLTAEAEQKADAKEKIAVG
jgi:hypothetical protein